MKQDSTLARYIIPQSGDWRDYLLLIRFNRPVGSLLLLWPTLWALFIAGNGQPSIANVIIFTLGVFVMRSAGCAINDFADRDFDAHVKRTQARPLAEGRLSTENALTLFAVLLLVSLALVLQTNGLTILMAVPAVALAAVYPYAKRHTHLAQIVLGAAFSWSIPMAFSAQTGTLPSELWLIYLTNLMWVVVYDTFYAMVDRDDDLKIGVKSTAILFAEMDKVFTGLLQCLTVVGLFMIGDKFTLGLFYYLGVVGAGGLFIYQQWLIRARDRDACFKAFLNNQWVGLMILLGLVIDYLV